MKTILQYQVLEAHTLADLEMYVSILIAKGWQPLGGVCAREYRFFQAMVLYMP